MNEHVDFERIVARHIASEGVAPASDAFYEELVSHAGRSGQRPEWLALIKEPPMRTNSHLAVGSPVARVAAITVATSLLAVVVAGAGIAGSRLLAADTTLVVDQSGNGDYTTLAQAVEAALDGGTILVRPGRYVESVAVVGKDLTIKGEGDRDEIIVEAASSALPIDIQTGSSEAASTGDVLA
jgi:hypothetical protein